MADIITIVTTAAGAFFFVAGSVGLLRFPDVFSRLHALTKADNLGLGLVAIGMIAQTESTATILKIVLIWLMTLLASAVVCHLIARDALANEIRRRRDADVDVAR